MISLYVYNSYISPRINPTFVQNVEYDIDREEKEKIAKFVFIGVKWCPYSKKAKPVLSEIRGKYENQKVNKHTIIFEEINGDVENDVTEFENTYKKKIEGFPAIFLIKDDNAAEYDTPITFDNLEQFIHAVL